MATSVDGAPPVAEKLIESSEQQIDPYNVSGGVDEHGNAKAIDYDRLRDVFGVQPLTDEHLARFEKVTGKKAHRLMRRKLFFSHRDFDKILDVYEQHGQFMLYTGRGPSSGSMHLGHTVPFLFTKELQEMFDVPLVIMLTDDEKYLYTRNKNQGHKGQPPDDFLDYGLENAKDIIALGAFGFNGSTNVGLIAYGAKQCVAAFPSSYPDLFGYKDYRAPDFDLSAKRRRKELSKIMTLIPCAIDQEPYFRMLRDRCERMTDPHPKTALILSKFLTALQGPGGKMSASDPNSAIFMTDTPNQIKSKINKHAFSGGRESLEEHRKHGGNPDVDVAYTYLSYFLESDEELEDLATKYRSGELLTGEMKARCIQELQKFVTAFQERRAKVDHAEMRKFMTPRKLEYKGNPNPLKPVAVEEEKAAEGEKSGGKDGRGTKGERKAAKLAEKKAEKLALREKDASAPTS
ncbi:hypothetical protein MRB53_039853 [Persea americana]|nr:hypothetical protein MRB53_039853 [Persea americana]